MASKTRTYGRASFDPIVEGSIDLRAETSGAEHRRLESELRRVRARYLALAGNLSYGVFRCAQDGSFLEVNRAFVAMLGYVSPNEVLGLKIMSTIVGDAAKRNQLLGRSNDSGLARPIEVQWTRNDGAPIRVRLSAQEISDENGIVQEYGIIAEDVTKQREVEDHLRRQASSDALTGLANYRQLIQMLDREIRRSKRTGRGFALLLFDMDGLKQLNDSYGHMAGSQALCRVADALTLCCRDIDTAARFGGDEFALLLPETGPRAATRVAERIRENIGQDENGPALSVSVGLAVYPRDGESIETVISAADSAMYAMKRRCAQ